MSKTLRKRIIAWIIDYGIIAGYAIVLFGLTAVFLQTTGFEPIINPYIAQLIGFATLTLPVVLYSFLTEKSSWEGTVGKKLQNISVLTDRNSRARNVLFRNLLKYLPWELAHTGVHWSVYYTSNNMEIPTWTWIMLILPQLLVIVYFISVVVSKGQSSAYDYLANTGIKVRKMD